MRECIDACHGFHLKSYQDINTGMIAAAIGRSTWKHRALVLVSKFVCHLVLVNRDISILCRIPIGLTTCCCYSAQPDFKLLQSACRAATTDLGNAHCTHSMASSPIKVVCPVCADCGAHAPSPSTSTERGSFSWLINFLPNQDPPENGPP